MPSISYVLYFVNELGLCQLNQVTKHTFEKKRRKKIEIFIDKNEIKNESIQETPASTPHLIWFCQFLFFRFVSVGLLNDTNVQAINQNYMTESISEVINHQNTRNSNLHFEHSAVV